MFLDMFSFCRLFCECEREREANILPATVCAQTRRTFCQQRSQLISWLVRAQSVVQATTLHTETVAFAFNFFFQWGQMGANNTAYKALEESVSCPFIFIVFSCWPFHTHTFFRVNVRRELVWLRAEGRPQLKHELPCSPLFVAVYCCSCLRKVAQFDRTLWGIGSSSGFTFQGQCRFQKLCSAHTCLITEQLWMCACLVLVMVCVCHLIEMGPSRRRRRRSRAYPRA